MTEIKVDPTHLHGIAQAVAAGSEPIQQCPAMLTTALGSLTSGIGTDDEAFSALCNSVHNFCDAYGSWFTVCGNGIAALAVKASSAADTYLHTDRHMFGRGRGDKPLPV
jgi:hypothetical protein